MKVGILTFHHTSNYGACLQAYALSQFIKSQGHQVEIIDYRPEEAEKFYWNHMRFLKILPPYRTPKFSLFDVDAFVRYIKYLKFQVFFSKNLPLSHSRFTRKEELQELKNKYELIISGSDQIWCLDTPFRGFDSSFFLSFIDNKNGCRTASYAASFGSTNNLGQYKEAISSLINQLDFVSVRDSNSLRLVNEVCEREASLVLDPTFLGDYKDLVITPKFRGRYLLIYYHGFLTETEQNTLCAFARNQNLAIVSVGAECPIADKNFVTADPGEWLGLFKNADFVLTNTFHGTIFSLIFRKNFAVIVNKEKQNKIDHLLKISGLEKYCLELTILKEDSLYLPEINYDFVWEKIDYEVIKSKNYLLKCLSS